MCACVYAVSFRLGPFGMVKIRETRLLGVPWLEAMPHEGIAQKQLDCPETPGMMFFFAFSQLVAKTPEKKKKKHWIFTTLSLEGLFATQNRPTRDPSFVQHIGALAAGISRARDRFLGFRNLANGRLSSVWGVAVLVVSLSHKGLNPQNNAQTAMGHNLMAPCWGG